MTDKVQKIREEVERLLNHVKDSNFESDTGAFYYLKDLLDFIDSLQEEPVRGEWIEELRTKLNSMSKEDFKKVFDKYTIDFDEEPVSEELEQVIDTYLKFYWGGEKEKQDWPFLKKMAIYFANWQKEQINEVLLSEVLPCFMHGGEADKVVAKLDEVLNKKK